MSNQRPAEAWEAEGQRLEAELDRAHDEWRSARENERWDAADHLFAEMGRLNDELAKHMK